MATPNRAAIVNKLQKALKKHFKPIEPAPRNLLEQAIFACCLENSHHAAAEEGFRTLSATYFDWNEVRVTTTKELAELLRGLGDAEGAAANVRRVLQTVFETTYSFDIDLFKKGGLGQALKRLEKIEGMTPFVLGYLTQNALGGHAIPIDRGTLDVLWMIGAITDAEHQKHQVPGLERLIPKAKGAEFASLLHQLGAEFVLNPHGTNLQKILLEIATDAKGRFPKRGSKRPPVADIPALEPKKKPEPPKPEPAKVEAKSEKADAKTPAAAKKGAEVKPAAKAEDKKTAATKSKEPKEAPRAKETKAKPAPPAAKKKAPVASAAKRKPR
jgi:endonuclease-3